jgi:hypothetical protein
MTAQWRQRAEVEMQRLTPPAQAVGLLGLHRDGLHLNAALGALSSESPIDISGHPKLEKALSAARPWICSTSEQPRSLHSDKLDSIWWPLHGDGIALGFLVVFGEGLERNGQFLSLLSSVAGHLVHRLLQRLHHHRGPAVQTPFGEQGLGRDPSWPKDPRRRLALASDDPMPTGGAEVSDASMLLQLALENPDGAAASVIFELDHLLISALTKRFLDTNLEAMLPLMARLPKSRKRLLKLMINAEDTQLRHDALHCLERWPDEQMAREVLPLAFSAENSVATAAARVLESCRDQKGFGVEVLKELRSLFSDSRAKHAQRRAMDLLIRFRDADAVPLLISRLDDPEFTVLCRRGLAEITLVQNRWGRAAWQGWYVKHAHEPRSLWLLIALDNRDMEIRSRAIAELYAETGENFGFDPSAPSKQRKTAIARARETITPGGASP